MKNRSLERPTGLSYPGASVGKIEGLGGPETTDLVKLPVLFEFINIDNITPTPKREENHVDDEEA